MTLAVRYESICGADELSNLADNFFSEVDIFECRAMVVASWTGFKLSAW
jgi:hypothetical protein